MKSKHIIGVAIPKLGKAKKKPNISKLKKKLWEVFTLYIKKRDKGICFTCGKYAEKGGYQGGHFIPKSAGGLALYFHEENVHGQCSWCNLHMQGNIYEYGLRLGEEKVAMLMKLKQSTVKWSVQDYEQKIEYYKEKLHE